MMKRNFFKSIIIVAICGTCLYAADEPIHPALPDVTIRGYIQAGYTAIQNDVEVSTDTFRIRRARLSITIKALPRVSGYIQGEMKDGEIEDVYIIYNAFPWLGIRLGRQKIPVSAEGNIREEELDFIEYSTMVDELIMQSPGNRDVGLKLVSKGSFWDGSGMISNGSGSTLEDDDEHKAFSGRIVFFKEHIRIGGSGYRSKGKNNQNTRYEKTIRYGGEIQLGDEAGFLKVEYLYGKDGNRKMDGWTVAGDTALPFVSPLVYRSLPLRFLVRFEQWDPDKDARDDKESYITFGLGYIVSGQVRCDVNYTLVQEEAETQISNNRFNAQVQLKF